jgi:hypothetical protein
LENLKKISWFKYLFEDKFTLTDIVLTSALPGAIDNLGLKECPCETVDPIVGELIKRVKENELKEYKKIFFKSDIIFRK